MRAGVQIQNMTRKPDFKMSTPLKQISYIAYLGFGHCISIFFRWGGQNYEKNIIRYLMPS